jgi:hypothetical protein
MPPDRGKALMNSSGRQAERFQVEAKSADYIRFKASRGSEQYHVMHCSIANL